MSSTTVHIPPALLQAVDARAKAARMSRNRYITRALERSLTEEDAFSPELLAELRRPLRKGDDAAIDSLFEAAAAKRSGRRKPPEL